LAGVEEGIAMGVTPNIERVEGTRSSKAMVDGFGQTG